MRREYCFSFVKSLLVLAACLLIPVFLIAGDNPKAPQAPGKPDDSTVKAQPQGETFQEKINAAIKKGVDFLLTRQKPDGSFPPYPDDEKMAVYPMGHTALVTLALLKCKVSPEDKTFAKAIARAFNYLSRLECKRTYSVAVYLMALEAKYYNTEKFKKHIDKKLRGFSTSVEQASASFDPKVHPADRKQAQKLVDWLVSAQVPNGAWTYVKGTIYDAKEEESKPVPYYPYDNSNTQYALLGLKAASRLGAKVPAATFVKNLQYFLKFQEKDGPKVPAFPIPAAHLDSFEYDAKQKKKKKRKGKYSTSSDYEERYGSERDEFRARGWRYTHTEKYKDRETCTMTSGAVACIIICKSEILKLKIFQKKLKKKTNEAIEDGCAWILKYVSARGCIWPGYPQYFYYMYGLERLGALSGIRTFGGRFDWYRKGATDILGLQKPDGHWEYDLAGTALKHPALKFHPKREIDTSFALLFLKRGTVGVIEGDLIYTGQGLLDKKAKKEKQEKKEEDKPEK